MNFALGQQNQFSFVLQDFQNCQNKKARTQNVFGIQRDSRQLMEKNIKIRTKQKQNIDCCSMILKLLNCLEHGTCF